MPSKVGDAYIKPSNCQVTMPQATIPSCPVTLLRGEASCRWMGSTPIWSLTCHQAATSSREPVDKSSAQSSRPKRGFGVVERQSVCLICSNFFLLRTKVATVATTNRGQSLSLSLPWSRLYFGTCLSETDLRKHFRIRPNKCLKTSF